MSWRRARYALISAGVALIVPLGLWVVRRAGHGEWPTYLYVTVSTAALTSALGALFGGWSERAHLNSITDPLTGLFNRRHFTARLEAEIARDRRLGLRTCVMCVDLDRLKTINDRFGHQRGDAALVAVARALSTRLRSRDLVARFGGDEFAVLLPDTQGSIAIEIGERILAELRTAAPETLAGLSVSIGIAELEGATTADQLLIAADRALYWAKGHGGGKVSLAPYAVIADLLEGPKP